MSVAPDPARNHLSELAAEVGIATQYDDWRGGRRQVADDTVIAVLAALDLDASTSETAERAASERRAAASRPGLPVCWVTRDDHPESVPVRLPAGRAARVYVETETGDRLDVALGPGTTVDAADGVELHPTPLPDLPQGYHLLRLETDDHRWSAPLIVTPARPGRSAGAQQWGLAIQLYSVRSRGSWGIGDFDDLARLGRWSAAEHGADYILINPIHAAEPRAPIEPSPYLPVSRRFVNPIYLRPELIPEYAGIDDATRRVIDGLRYTAATSDRTDDDIWGSARIDRDAIWGAKLRALQLIFAEPRNDVREKAYQAFLEREGVDLDHFAAWCMIAEQYGSDWRAWPDALQDPDSVAVRVFVHDHLGRLDFHRWLQWVTDEQLARAQQECLDAGMRLGLMPDLAVGVHPGGADTWGRKHLYADGISVGAPPDAYNQNGQNWSQRPWRPDRLAADGYQPFVRLVRSVLRHAGAVRIDHIIGLFRLWWIPDGAGPGAGAYLHYDYAALVGILALEAERAGAVVVGEDLGTVDPRARSYLGERGILGTSILWFENDDDGMPKPPGSWRESCLASATTHDLPPNAAYLAGDHVRLRARLGLLTRPYEDEVAADRQARSAWLAELVAAGVLAEQDQHLADEAEHRIDRDLVDRQLIALHRYLALTPAQLINVALVDATGDRRAQNLPGTTDQYPNWRVPLSDSTGRPVSLEDVFTLSRVAEVIGAVTRSDLGRAGPRNS
ncbi:4-alpha-glucanotransferase [Microlunatus endophyticus]|uniref:4-alpha-glucanotransferase n=1 Tax=Microlunatus endophyticus TaxID=1716077 RepID=A0A917SAD1_9ACTN|nr:4-alpha-glucanotransferase [Microlunatus endophyticus]GGL67715.1 4-alpha-glucanotransferase [Microlunatus endophyticus]